MRTLPAHDWLESKGARFEERDGNEVCTGFSDLRSEYGLIREKIAVGDLSQMQKYRSDDEEAIYFLDEVLAANVANIRYGRVLHTFLANERGEVVSDVYVASNEEEILVLCESCVPDAEVDRLLLGDGSGPLQRMTDELAVLSVDGPQAWAVPRDLFSPDILGMPYLSVETQDIDGLELTLIRAGKTSEFGYIFVTPRSEAAVVLERLLAAGEPHGAGLCGMAAYDAARLDGRFFNIHCEGREVKDPLALGLQWMIDFEKEKFVGREPILARREQGLQHKIVGVAREMPGEALQIGDELLLDGEQAGPLITVDYSFSMDRQLGLALLRTATAFAELAFTIRRDGQDLDQSVVSVSMPPILPKSLAIKLDEI